MNCEASADVCDFCAIGRGATNDVEVICEGPEWVAFLPLDPATPGHTLVIPRQHVSDLWYCVPPLDAVLASAVIRVGRAVRQALHPHGMNLMTSAGSAAEQTVFHLHLHVVPRWKQDGFGKIWPTDSKYEDESLDNIADLIRDACDTSLS